MLGDFKFHADVAACNQAKDLVSSMIALALSQIVPSAIHHAGHTLDLIFSTVIKTDLIATDKLPWSDHYALKAQPSSLALFHQSGGKLIYVHSQRLTQCFQNLLQDLMPPDNLLDALVED